MTRHFTHQAVELRDRKDVFELFVTASSTSSSNARRGRHRRGRHTLVPRAPLVDFHMKKVGTRNLLEATRRYAREAVAIWASRRAPSAEVA